MEEPLVEKNRTSELNYINNDENNNIKNDDLYVNPNKHRISNQPSDEILKLHVFDFKAKKFENIYVTHTVKDTQDVNTSLN